MNCNGCLRAVTPCVGGVFKGYGIADFAISAALVFIHGRYARPGGEGVPSIAIAWGIVLAGYIVQVLVGFQEDVTACSEKGTNNMTKSASVRVHIFMRVDIYVDIFS